MEVGEDALADRSDQGDRRPTVILARFKVKIEIGTCSITLPTDALVSLSQVGAAALAVRIPELKTGRV